MSSFPMGFFLLFLVAHLAIVLTLWLSVASVIFPFFLFSIFQTSLKPMTQLKSKFEWPWVVESSRLFCSNHNSTDMGLHTLMTTWSVKLSRHLSNAKNLPITSLYLSMLSISPQIWSIHSVIKFVSDLRQVGGFLRVLWFPPPIKLTTMI